MNDVRLQALYNDLLNKHFPHEKYPLKAQFYNTKSLRHTIELNSKIIIIRIAERFRTAPQDILSILGIILLAKLFRYKIDRSINRAYREYLKQHILPFHTHQKRKPSPKYRAEGNVYDLNVIFDRINRNFFDNKLQKPILGWSLRKSYARLGFYSSERNLLVISRIFDSKKVPPEVVEFLMYHEMLHVLFPVEEINGRRCIHPLKFRRYEKLYPDYEKIQAWIKKRREKL